MTRIDWLVLKRLGGRIGLTIVMVFGLICLVESLNTWRFEALAAEGGVVAGIMGIVTTAGVWSLNTLPVTVLVGAIAALLDLQARRETTIIRAAGVSVWRTMRAPFAAALVFGLIVSLGGDAALVTLMRHFGITSPDARATGVLWLEQHAGDSRYIVLSQQPHAQGTMLDQVMFFLPPELGNPRIRADRAVLREGAWHIEVGTAFAPDTEPRRVRNLAIPTNSNAADLRARLASPTELTLIELVQIVSAGVSDPVLRSAVEMRLARIVAMPLMLAGSLVIAFAFTSGYRRSNKYGTTVLYGIVLGFVVYVLMEMASRAGAAGLIEPVVAALAPALVAMGIGTTVLLYREDGRR